MLQPSAQRVQGLLTALGHAGQVREFPAGTKTSADAAAAIGCSLAQIAKSLIFRAEPSGRSVMVIVSGVNRVSEALVGAMLGEKLGRADAAFVREQTGFAIGGVPPIGHRVPPVVFIDRDLMGFAEIWSAAGTPYSVFPLSPADLLRLTGGQAIAIA